MGVFPQTLAQYQEQFCLPHARGGVSMYITSLEVTRDVFPTPVGVFPTVRPMLTAGLGLPRACGGVCLFLSFVCVNLNYGVAGINRKEAYAW